MIKINCHWYSCEEVEEALRKKGYTIVTLETSTDPRNYPLYQTYALKDSEPSPITTLKSVALREFSKKPKLI